MLENATDEELINLYINDGDEEGLKILIERYTSPLYNYVCRIINRNDASDVVSETFIKIWRNLKKFNKKKSSFKTWIFTITRNTATDFLRKKKSLLFSDLENNNNNEGDNTSFLENIKDEEPLIDEVLENIQDLKILNKLLDTISLKYKEILILHYQEEMTFKEISEVLHKPLNTVKNYHHRALIELRKNAQNNI